MSLRQMQSRMFLWVKQSPFLRRHYDFFVAHKEVSLAGLAILNIVVLGSLFLASLRQSAYLARQNQALNQIAALETKLESANQQASNNNGALQQLQISVAQIAKEQSIPLLKVLGATATDLSGHNLSDPTKEILQDELVATGGAVTASTDSLVSPIPTPATINPTPSPSAPTPMGIIEINASNKNGKPIYDAPNSTKIVETASPNTVMLYYQKQGGWYKVDPPTHLGIYGWVQQDNVTEIPNVTELPR